MPTAVNMDMDPIRREMPNIDLTLTPLAVTRTHTLAYQTLPERTLRNIDSHHLILPDLYLEVGDFRDNRR